MTIEQAEQVLLQLIAALKLTEKERDVLKQAVAVLKAKE